MNYNFKIVKYDTLYQGFNTLKVLNFNFEKFDGSTSRTVTREIYIKQNCVGLLPYDPIRKEVILIEQIRCGPLYNEEHPWLFEIIAGIIDENEDKTKSAIREAKEEANCDVIKLIPIYEYYTTPGSSSEKIKIFCGITNTANASGVFGVADEDEDIRVHVFSLHEAEQMLEQGKINNASTIIALQWLFLNQHKIPQN